MSVRAIQYLMYGIKVDFKRMATSRFNENFWEAYADEYGYTSGIRKVGYLQFVSSALAGYYMIGHVIEVGNENDGMVGSFCLDDITSDTTLALNKQLTIQNCILEAGFTDFKAKFHLVTVYN